MGKGRSCRCGKGWRPCRIRAIPRAGGILWRRSWPWRYAPCWATAQLVCHRPGGSGASGVDPSLGLCQGAAPWRRYQASYFPAAGAAFAVDLIRKARAAADKRSVLAGDGKALRGLPGDELPGVRLVAAYAVETGLGVGQKGGEDPA